jgi:anti-anti-sigma factor
MRSALDISIELEGSRAVLSLEGELDSTNIETLMGCLAELDPQFGTVVLDLAGLMRIDSTAMHALVTLRDELALRMQRLECRNVNGSPAQMLEMSGVAESFGGT